MVRIGEYNRLKVVKTVDFGVYLDGGNGVEILLPTRYITKPLSSGDEIDVFIYNDSEDRLIATTEHPFATVGEFAYLQVTAVTRFGAFLDWGLPKDLLVPFREQKATMRQGGIYLVYVYLDNASKRIAASAKIEKFLGNKFPELREGQKVKALPYAHTEIGYKTIVDNLYYGMIYEDETYSPVQLGTAIEAYVKHVREDGKIDLSVLPKAAERVDSLSERIYAMIAEAGGSLDVGDKTSPERIKEMFQCSKKDFKKALGHLYKERRIAVGPESISIEPAK